MQHNYIALCSSGEHVPLTMPSTSLGCRRLFGDLPSWAHSDSPAWTPPLQPFLTWTLFLQGLWGDVCGRFCESNSTSSFAFVSQWDTGLFSSTCRVMHMLQNTVRQSFSDWWTVGRLLLHFTITRHFFAYIHYIYTYCISFPGASSWTNVLRHVPSLSTASLVWFWLYPLSCFSCLCPPVNSWNAVALFSRVIFSFSCSA